MATRLNLNVSDQVDATLRTLAAEQDTTMTEVLRRALSVYKFLHDQSREGKTLHLLDHQERVERVHLV